MRLRSIAFAAVAFACVAARGAEYPENYLRADEIKRGMTGYGLSVFRGVKIEKFQVEIIGVLRNAMPKQHIVIARMSGAGLEKTGIIGGMSGSPIYLKVGDAFKLAGAVAYGWSFPKEPVCGITPIENMYSVVGAMPPKAEKAADGALDAPVRVGQRTYSAVRVAAAAPGWDKLASDAGSLYRLRTPLTVSGLTEPAFQLLRKELEPFGFLPVQGGGAGADEAAEAKLAPGSALSIRMAEGDLEMNGVGTCTEVIGNTILGFGHPMFGEGRVSVPMATGVVHLSFASVQRSFKLASAAKTVGRLTADVQACVMGTIGDFAHQIPVTVRFRRSDVKGESRYQCKVFDHPTLTSRIIGMFLMNSTLVQGDLPRENTVRAKIAIRLEGRAPIVIEDAWSGISTSRALMGALSAAIRPVATLGASPFGKVSVEGVDAEITVQAGEITAKIEAMRLERNELRPGDTVRATVTIRPTKRDPYLKTLELKLPDDMPPGPATVIVCDSASSLRYDQQDRPYRYVARDLDQTVALAREYAPHQQLAIRIKLPDRGISTRGVELPSLPPSMLNVVAPHKTTGLSATGRSIKAVVKTADIVSGAHALPLLILPRELP